MAVVLCCALVVVAADDIADACTYGDTGETTAGAASCSAAECTDGESEEEVEEAAGPVLEIKFETSNGTGDDPTIVVWLEDRRGRYIRTLWMFSEDPDYYHELSSWYLRYRRSRLKSKEDVDAVVGATIKWRRSRTVEVSTTLEDGKSLLAGGYTIRMESTRDKGGHFRTFRIPIGKDYQGGEYEHKGYVKKVTITVKE